MSYDSFEGWTADFGVAGALPGTSVEEDGHGANFSQEAGGGRSFEARFGAGLDGEAETAFSKFAGGHHDEVGPKIGSCQDAQLWKHAALEQEDKKANKPGQERGAARVFWRRPPILGGSVENSNN